MFVAASTAAFSSCRLDAPYSSVCSAKSGGGPSGSRPNISNSSVDHTTRSVTGSHCQLARPAIRCAERRSKTVFSRASRPSRSEESRGAPPPLPATVLCTCSAPVSSLRSRVSWTELSVGRQECPPLYPSPPRHDVEHRLGRSDRARRVWASLARHADRRRTPARPSATEPKPAPPAHGTIPCTAQRRRPATTVATQ